MGEDRGRGKWRGEKGPQEIFLSNPALVVFFHMAELIVLYVELLRIA